MFTNWPWLAEGGWIFFFCILLYYFINVIIKTYIGSFIVVHVIYFTEFLPQGGNKWIVSAGDYVDNSFTALGISNPREVRLQICSSSFCFLLTEFHYTFSMSYKILPYYVY